jgi:selenophosphate synthetase-related protein
MTNKLHRIVKEVRDYWGLRRKQPIGKLVTILQKEGFKCPHVLSSIGEDSAAIDLGGENLILLTTDAVVPELAATKPYVAGYAAILVNINDIFAAGGRPIVAMVNIAFRKIDTGVKFMKGICEAGQKFRVEVVRGHTTPDAPTDGVSASICGIVRRTHYISAGGAQTGDSLILAIDLEGRVSPNYKYGWDTTVIKSSKDILYRYEAMRVLAEKQLLHASKDLSNGGIIGTVLLLLEYAQRGALIDIEQIPRPQNLDLTDWLKMYISTGFVVSTTPSNEETVLSIFQNHGMTAKKIGLIDASRQLTLQKDSEREIVFDFTKEAIVAPPEPPPLDRLKPSN